MEIIEILTQLFKGGTVMVVIAIILATLWVVREVYKIHLKALEDKDKAYLKVLDDKDKEHKEEIKKFEKRISDLENEVKQGKLEQEASRRDREVLRAENDRLNSYFLALLGKTSFEKIKANV